MNNKTCESGANTKLCGASNGFFFCFMRDGASFSIKHGIAFKENVCVDEFKRAANEAIKLFPEFAVRPVIKGNRVRMEKNRCEIAVFSEPGPLKYYGTDDTNGYLFYFVCSGKNLTAYLNHGFSDAFGLTAFLKSVLVLYAGYTGSPVTDPQLLASVRTPSDPKFNANAEDAFDPYRYYGDTSAAPEYIFENPGAYTIPAPLFDPAENRIREILVDISTSEFIRLTKQIGASFTPLMIDVAAQAVFRNYDTAGDPFVAMLPVDLRRFFGSSTLVNFSDGISVPGYREKDIPDTAARCAAMKEVMQKQMTKAGFANLIGGKAAAVDRFFADKSELASRPLPSPAAGKKPYTLPFSYPGKLTFGAQLDEMIADASITGHSRVNSVISHTYGDKMQFSFVWRSDDISYINHFCEELRRRGFDPSVKDNGLIKRDLFSLSKLATE